MNFFVYICVRDYQKKKMEAAHASFCDQY